MTSQIATADITEVNSKQIQRRCIASGEVSSRSHLLRFVLGPQSAVVPDLAGKLPGRGVYVRSQSDSVKHALKRNLFVRSLGQAAKVPADLAEQVEIGLVRRIIDSIALARKAGLAVCGYEKCRKQLAKGRVAALICAKDGDEGAISRLANIANSVPCWRMLSGRELGLAFGRDYVLHSAFCDGGTTRRIITDLRRLAGMRLKDSEESISV